MTIISIDISTHKRLIKMSNIVKDNEPDTKVTHDYIIRKLLDKYEGVSNE